MTKQIETSNKDHEQSRFQRHVALILKQDGITLAGATMRAWGEGEGGLDVREAIERKQKESN